MRRMDNHAPTADEILSEIGTEGPVGARPPAKIRYTHDAMIDMIIANPRVSQNELGRQFGYTAAWVSTIMSSDAFKARLASRREQMVDPVIAFTMQEKLQGVLDRSLEVLGEKLSAPTHSIPDNLALQAAAFGAKALGLGGNAATPANQVPADYLATLAHRLTSLRAETYRAEPLTVEGETRNVQAEE